MKLHPLSVPYRAIAGSANVGVGILLATALGSGFDPLSPAFLGTVAVYLTASILYQVAYYRRFEYELGDGSLDITSGVFNRRDREIPLSRIQNVDVSQNPVQRAMGIATLTIETAGGGDTEAGLKYVSTDRARELRTELRRLAREDEGVETDDPAGSADRAHGERGDLVFALPNRNLVLLSLFTLDPGAGVVSSMIGAIVSSSNPENLVGIGTALEFLPGGQLAAILFGVAAIAVLTWLLSVALTFARYYGFELRRTRDGLEYERGLLQRFSGTIPLEKVQTVSIRENVLKRQFGYATVAVETAGYSPGQSTRGRQLAVPLAARDRAIAIARDVEPFEAAGVERPPRRARERYVFRYAGTLATLVGIAAAIAWWFGALEGVDPIYGLALLAPLALVPVAAHYTWVHRGYRTEDGYFLARSGFWRRVTRVVPYYRIQTVVDGRTVFQRRRNLASVTADTASSSSIVGGGATAIDLDGADATRLRERLRDRLQESLRTWRRERRGRPTDADRGSGAGGTAGESQGSAADAFEIDDVDGDEPRGGHEGDPGGDADGDDSRAEDADGGRSDATAPDDAGPDRTGDRDPGSDGDGDSAAGNGSAEGDSAEDPSE